MTEASFFSCCRESPLPGAAEGEPGPFLSTVERGTVPAEVYRGPEVLGLVLLPPTRRIAIHEAGHACGRIALGGKVISATVELQPHVKFDNAHHDAMGIVSTLTGPAAEQWMSSRVSRIPDDELGPWVIAIRDLRGGHCDRCSAVRSTICATIKRSRMTAASI